ncbi:hypothetical protein INR49_031673, partial [Caranx melampygus]
MVSLAARTFALAPLSDLFTLPQCGNAGCSDDIGVAAVDLILQLFALPCCGHNPASSSVVDSVSTVDLKADRLAQSDYPRNRHPGWSRGSVAYHADDGKIFHGSGVGDAFGPRCFKGDIMGCGIMFPRDYILDGE